MHKGRTCARRPKKWVLPVAAKSDSQDICFVPSGRYSDIVARLRPNAVAPGDIVDLDGRVLGRHDGIIHYTIGQRRGLGIAAGEPLFVVELDARRQRVVVGPRSALLTTTVHLRDINWLGDGPLDQIPTSGLEISARIRSSQPPRPAILRAITPDGGGEVELLGGEHGVAPGQACVFYSATRIAPAFSAAAGSPQPSAATRHRLPRRRWPRHERAPDRTFQGCRSTRPSSLEFAGVGCR